MQIPRKAIQTPLSFSKQKILSAKECFTKCVILPCKDNIENKQLMVKAIFNLCCSTFWFVVLLLGGATKKQFAGVSDS